MNQKPTPNPDDVPEFSAIADRVNAAIHSRQRTLRVFASAAFLLGFLAVAASGIIVSAYFVFYRPKEKEVLRQVTLAAEQAKAHPAPAENGAAPKLPFDFPSVQATMTFFHSVVIAALSVAVGLLALGTLVLLAVVVLSRRVTLYQINASLTQLSGQLGRLRLEKSRE